MWTAISTANKWNLLCEPSLQVTASTPLPYINIPKGRCCSWSCFRSEKKLKKYLGALYKHRFGFNYYYTELPHKNLLTDCFWDFSLTYLLSTKNKKASECSKVFFSMPAFLQSFFCSQSNVFFCFVRLQIVFAQSLKLCFFTLLRASICFYR